MDDHLCSQTLVFYFSFHIKQALQRSQHKFWHQSTILWIYLLKETPSNSLLLFMKCFKLENLHFLKHYCNAGTSSSISLTILSAIFVNVALFPMGVYKLLLSLKPDAIAKEHVSCLKGKFCSVKLVGWYSRSGVECHLFLRKFLCSNGVLLVALPLNTK